MTSEQTAVLYVVPACPLCESARLWLREHSVPFAERDVANEYAALRRMYKNTMQPQVPVIEYRGRFLVRPTVAELADLFA